jgi:hypothetical protein
MLLWSFLQFYTKLSQKCHGVVYLVVITMKNQRIFIFFSFPNKNKSPKIYRQWLNKIKRSKFTPSKHSRVCSSHFKESDYEYSALLKKQLLSAHGKTKLFLKKDAIPTLRLPGNNENESNRHSLYQEKKSRKEIVDNAIASTSQQQVYSFHIFLRLHYKCIVRYLDYFRRNRISQ